MTKITLTAGHVLATTVIFQPDQQKETVPRMWKLGRAQAAQVWKKQRLFFCRPKKGDDVPSDFSIQHLVVANSYTCGLPILHTGLGFWKKQHPIERLLGIRQLQVDVFAQPTSASQRCLFLRGNVSNYQTKTLDIPWTMSHADWFIFPDPWFMAYEIIWNNH